MVHHAPLNISSKVSTLKKSDSVLPNVKLETSVTMAKCIPGTRVGYIESNLKLLAKSGHKYGEAVMILEHGSCRSLKLLLIQSVHRQKQNMAS